jgi:hypothetical protein
VETGWNLWGMLPHLLPQRLRRQTFWIHVTKRLLVRSIYMTMTRLRTIGFSLVLLVSTGVAGVAFGQPSKEAPSNTESLPPSCRAENWGEGEAATRRNAKSKKVVVPAGATEMLLCRYWGYGVLKQTKKTQARAGKLSRERHFRRLRLVRSLSRDFNRSRPARGTYSCPFDDGANLYAEFSYTDQPSVIVEAHLHGCRFVYNGFGQGGFPPAGLLHQLERLSKPQD